MMIKPKGKYAIYRAALDTYGARSQTVVAMEEMLHSCAGLASCYKSAKINRLAERLKGESNVQKTDV